MNQGKTRASDLEGPTNIQNLKFHPLTRDRWADLEKLFGDKGACGGCWCMWWRLKRLEFLKQRGESNRKALRAIVDSDRHTGIIAYSQGWAIAWCSFAPREEYPALERSRVLKRVDDEPVWSVVCFFVDRSWRGKGVTVQLLKAAVEEVREQGGRIVEGYPIDPVRGRLPTSFAYTGLVSAFRKAGFAEVARRSETRPIMRLRIEG